MAFDSAPSSEVQIAHILFMDMVSYSLLPLEEQTRLVRQLQEVVRGTGEFARAEARGELIRLPAGDGMALVFLRDPLAPLRCAIEIARSTRSLPTLRLRMGIHSGPVSRGEDINAAPNVAGSGVNMAHRVMDCGDAGHILLSYPAADILFQMGAWESCIHDLGECEVKHGIRLHLFNFSDGEVGNAAPPAKTGTDNRGPSGEKDFNTRFARDTESTEGTEKAFRERSRALAETQPDLPSPSPSAFSVPPVPSVSLAKRVLNLPASQETTIGEAQGSQIALLYKRDAQPDEDLLKLLEAALQVDGHRVFIDRHLTIGVEWAKEIERQVRGSDAVVPLLSAASVQSEMLAYELQIAHEAGQEQQGRPRILPVRVNYHDPLPAPLAAILDRIEYILWESPADDDRLVTQILEALRRPTAPDRPARSRPAVPPGKLEPVGGAVPLDSQFYVVRPSDDDFRAAIARRDSIVLVKGARQMGKTSLLARGLQQAREAGDRVVLTDFQKLNASHLESAESFFLALAEWLADRLDLDVVPEETWNTRRGASVNFERFLRREVFSRVSEPIIWGLDEVDRLFTCSFGSEVFGLFRSWHNERALDPTGPWSRLTLAIAYATEAHLFITDVNQSPFNVGTRLQLEDFSFEQVADLNRRYGSPLRDGGEIARYQRLVSGHPYLVRRGLHEMANRGIPLPAFEAQAGREEGIFGDHLRRILVLLVGNPELCSVVRELLRGRLCPTAQSFYHLRSAGLISGESERDARPRCQLYATYLERHLL